MPLSPASSFQSLADIWPTSSSGRMKNTTTKTTVGRADATPVGWRRRGQAERRPVSRRAGRRDATLMTVGGPRSGEGMVTQCGPEERGPHHVVHQAPMAALLVTPAGPR